MQEARGQHDDEAVKRAINEYEDALGRYIPVLMAQAKIYWELDMYQQASKLLCKLQFDIFKTNITIIWNRYLTSLFNYSISSAIQVEKIFRKSVEFCNESDTWKLNVAHVLFMVRYI